MADLKLPDAPARPAMGNARSRVKSLVSASVPAVPDQAMRMKMQQPAPTTVPPDDDDGVWPAQADLVLSAIEAGRHDGSNRRAANRRPFRAKASLRLFSDPPQANAWPLYTRDVHARGLGFITPHRLPLGYGGAVEIPLPDGTSVTVACTLLRCREAAPGWYEGSLYFNRDQPEFAG